MQLNQFKESINRLGLHVIAGGFTIIGLIPQKAAVAISRMLARLWFVFDRRHRCVAINNLTYVFGYEKSPTEIRHMARRIFANIVWIVFEIGWAYRSSEKEMARYIRFEGMANLRQARRRGRGVLVLTAHLGNWELLVNAAGMLETPVSVVYRPLDFSPLDMFFRKLRGRHGVRLLPKAKSMRAILKGLARNELVGILLDQNARQSEAVFVDFFGKPARTNRGLALIAQRTRAPVVPMFLVREGKQYRMVIEPELPLITSGDKARDVKANTRLYNQVLESFIRRYPEQWFWVHRRWKSQPKTDNQEK